MKKLLIIITLVLISSLLEAKCNDSLLIVSAQKIDTCNFKIKLVFENVSNDSILLFGNFKNYREVVGNAPGINISFFNNREFFFPQEGEMPTLYYKIGNGRIIIPPKRSIEYIIDLSQYVWNPVPKDEYGIKLRINYRYYLMKPNKLDRRLCFNETFIDYFRIN